MGIVSFFRRLFSKDIIFKGDGKSHLVYVYKPKKGRIWFEKNISVPENMQFYFAKNGVVLDGFVQGEHELVPMYLSKTIKTLKLYKKKKKHKEVDYFFADGYFINLLQSEIKPWKLFARAEFFDEKFGYFKAMLEGKYIAKVANAKKFLKTLLTVYDFLRQGEAEDILEGLISECVFKEMFKSKADFAFLQDNIAITDFLFEKVVKSLEKSGIEILGFSVEKTTFSRNLRKTIKKQENQEKNQKMLQEKMKILEESLQENSKEKLANMQDDKAENITDVKSEEKSQETEKEKKIELLYPIIKKQLNQDLAENQNLTENQNQNLFESQSLIIEEMPKKSLKDEINKGKEEQNKDFESKSLKNEILASNKIDKKAHNSYTNLETKSFKVESTVFIKCPLCGENNQIESKNCVLCGENLER